MSTPIEAVDTRCASVHQAAAPVTGWRRAISDWLLVGGTTLLCHAIGAVTSLLLRVLLDPAQMGIWQGVKLFLGYANYANLGISKGAVRELTVARGRGEQASAQEGLNLAFTVNTITSSIYAIVVIAVGVWIAYRGGSFASSWAWGLIVVGLLAVLSRYVTFHVTILRGQQSFKATSRLSVIEGLLTLIVGGFATWQWGLIGLYLATIFGMLVTLGYVWRYRGASLHWAWNGPEIGRLIAVGGPILLATTLFALFRSLDKLMILAYLSDREYQLGCYSIALMVTTQLYGLGGITSMVMSPRFGEKFGASGNRTDVARLAVRTGELQAVAMALAAGLSLVLAGPVLGWLLPKYQPGLVPTCWLIPGAVLLTLAMPANHYLIAINRQRRAVLVVAAVIVMAAVANHGVLIAGWGLTGLAMATTAAYACYFILVLGVSLWVELPTRERLRYLGMTSLALLPTLVTALLVAQVEPLGQVHWTSLAARMALVVAVWSITSTMIWHLGNWREHLAR